MERKARVPRFRAVNKVMGGSNGHTMLELAQNFPQLKIIVQDLATVQPLWNEARHSFCAS